MTARIGLLSPGSPQWPMYAQSFERGLTKVGLKPGQDVELEIRFANMSYQGVYEAAEELVGLQPDVLVGGMTHEALGLRRRTDRIPIVVGVSNDPVNTGLVKSLDSPDEQVTGQYVFQAAFAKERLDLLTEVFGHLERVGLIWPCLEDESALDYRLLRDAAAAAGTALESYEMRSVMDFASFARRARDEVPVTIVMGGVYHVLGRGTVSQALRDYPLKGLAPTLQVLDGAGLMSCDIDFMGMIEASAELVKAILDGAAPKDLPMRTVHEHRVTIHTEVAAALEVVIPASVRDRAQRLP